MLMREVILDVRGASVDERARGTLRSELRARGRARAADRGGGRRARRPTSSRAVQERCASERLRVYTSDDPVGVELGGALKNVIAIAAGACDGLGYGHNSRAALITRGLAEIVRLAMAKGGNALTLAGLAGLGDLVLTCTGELSRNRTVGVEMGAGAALARRARRPGSRRRGRADRQERLRSGSQVQRRHADHHRGVPRALRGQVAEASGRRSRWPARCKPEF